MNTTYLRPTLGFTHMDSLERRALRETLDVKAREAAKKATLKAHDAKCNPSGIPPRIYV